MLWQTNIVVTSEIAKILVWLDFILQGWKRVHNSEEVFHGNLKK